MYFWFCCTNRTCKILLMQIHKFPIHSFNAPAPPLRRRRFNEERSTGPLRHSFPGIFSLSLHPFFFGYVRTFIPRHLHTSHNRCMESKPKIIFEYKILKYFSILKSFENTTTTMTKSSWMTDCLEKGEGPETQFRVSGMSAIFIKG